MSRIEKAVVCVLFLAACVYVDVSNRRLKALEAKCPCAPACPCTECRCEGALPKPGTPLVTARVHDGQAFIAWIDENGRRQERMMTEREFDQLNGQGK